VKISWAMYCSIINNANILGRKRNHTSMNSASSSASSGSLTGITGLIAVFLLPFRVFFSGLVADFSIRGVEIHSRKSWKLEDSRSSIFEVVCVSLSVRDRKCTSYKHFTHVAASSRTFLYTPYDYWRGSGPNRSTQGLTTCRLQYPAYVMCNPTSKSTSMQVSYLLCIFGVFERHEYDFK
jgi:hypothetical protein